MTEKTIMIRLTEKEADAVADALFDYAEGIKLMYQEYLKADFMKGDKEAVHFARNQVNIPRLVRTGGRGVGCCRKMLEPSSRERSRSCLSAR